MKNQNKFYWIKLRTDFFNQDTIDFLMSQENGSDYVVLYQMLCLNTANTDGRLINEIGEVIVPYNIEKIARDTKYFNVDTVLVALELYKKIGLVYVEDDGNLRITDIERMVGTESASRDAIKKREQRLKKKIIEGTQKGTNCLIENRDKRLDIRDKNIDIYINNIYNDQIETKKDKLEDEFDSLWSIYPKKEGKKKALESYKRARKKGTTYEEVEQGINNYKKHIEKKNISSTYIKQGSTYFNQECWTDDYSSDKTFLEQLEEELEKEKNEQTTS